jgi:hypothetical protein
VIGAVSWDKWAAIGTLALAAATFAVVLIGAVTVWYTRRLAVSAHRTAEADTRAVEGSIRPLITPAPRGTGAGAERINFTHLGVSHVAEVAAHEVYVHHGSEGRWLVSVPVRNAGVGPAIIGTPHPWIRVLPDTAVTQGHATERVVPVGERTRLDFVVPRDTLGSFFYAQVAYTDADGGQLRRTELFVVQDSGSSTWSVRGFALFRGADGDFIVESGEGWDVVRRERQAAAR